MHVNYAGHGLPDLPYSLSCMHRLYISLSSPGCACPPGTTSLSLSLLLINILIEKLRHFERI